MAQALPIYNKDDDGYPTRPDTRKKVRNTAVRSSKKILLAIITILMSLFGLLLRSQRYGKKYPDLNPQTFSSQAHFDHSHGSHRRFGPISACSTPPQTNLSTS